jgi:ferrous-iron efflux pump FieF
MAIDARHRRLLHLATRASLAVASVLILCKAVAWYLSGSVSLLAGLTDSILDGAASFLNLLAVHYSLRPADEDHRYGHGKAEALAGMGQALFIGVSAVFIAIQGAERLRSPAPIGEAGIGIAVMVLSLVLTLGLLMLQHKVVKETGSTAVRADSLHYRSDLMLNGSILIALLLAHWGYPQVDALFGLAISLYILWSAFQIGKESSAILMDQELDPGVAQDMLALACAVPGVIGAHDLRTRMSGQHWFVQLHLELPGTLSLSAAHALCEQVEAAIIAQFPKAEVLVHADPEEAVNRDQFKP